MMPGEPDIAFPILITHKVLLLYLSSQFKSRKFDYFTKMTSNSTYVTCLYTSLPRKGDNGSAPGINTHAMGGRRFIYAKLVWGY